MANTIGPGAGSRLSGCGQNAGNHCAWHCGRMSALAALAHAIDLERYPIDDLDGPAARVLVGRCREELGRLGACELEGFLRADAVTDAVGGVQGVQSLAFRTETTHNLEFTGREADL